MERKEFINKLTILCKKYESEEKDKAFCINLQFNDERTFARWNGEKFLVGTGHDYINQVESFLLDRFLGRS